jgi:hypothetical protein
MPPLLSTRSAVLLLLLAGCGGDDIPGPQEQPGTLTVAVAVTGVDVGSGYVVTADDNRLGTVGPGLTTRFFLVPSTYSVRLTGLPENCTVVEPTTVPAAVGYGQTARVNFQVQCTAVTTTIEVTTQTTGRDFAASYTVEVDGAQDLTVPTAIAPTGTVTFERLPAGQLSVTLSGVTDNCEVAGSNVQTFTLVTGGLERDIGRAVFDVSCAATTGDVRVRATTTGVARDADGYYMEVDGVQVVEPCSGFYCGFYYDYNVPALLTPHGEYLIPQVAPGSRSIRLTDIAANCSVSGSNPAPRGRRSNRRRSSGTRRTC